MILRTFTRYGPDGVTCKEYPINPRTLADPVRRALHDLNYRPSDETVQRIADQLRRNGRSAYTMTHLTLGEK